MELTAKQAEALEKFLSWHRSGVKTPFLLQGYAGTGKTTLVNTILDHVEGQVGKSAIALACPTGKAAKVLTDRTGRKASTIHRLLYKPLGQELKELQNTLAILHGDLENAEDPATIEKLIAKVEEEIDELEKQDPEFSFKEREDIRLLILDECSMVTEAIMNDVLKMEIPTLLVGDPGQLPPVKAKAGWEGMEPDAVLTEIVRTTGSGSGINLAAEQIRFGREPFNGEGFTLHPRKTLAWDAYAAADLVLCGTNALRQALNKGIRKYEGKDDPIPLPGERLISLSNEAKYDIVNGEMLYLKQITSSKYRIWEGWFESETGEAKKIRFWSPLFQNDMDQDKIPTNVARLTHARAMTVHKAQGSEAHHVIVCDNWPGRDHERWLYTGVTRGKSQVDLVSV